MPASSVVQQENIIFIKGAVLFQNVAFIQKMLINVLKANKFQHYILDLRLLDVVDSSALAMFIELKKFLHSAQLTCEFINATDLLLSLAQVYGLEFIQK
ncbi:MAG: STAS domain-containing protein [Gammaproteobacteria bacterium]|nr:STAS domain-containing protein [Gammaproteobacteria bacterium]MCD8542100.1 STAS domain-containing protein [Gammaproteobacteria bacterium]